MISAGRLSQSENIAQEGADIFEKHAGAAICAMRTSIQEPPSVPELAEEARVTPWHFIRMFRRMVGIPPGKYLAALRIESSHRGDAPTGYSPSSPGRCS
ncbi:MAG: hypothetical protein D084_Lepto4C00422G0007 [Leptospirillum sp. Group IV 'UBA BS']|nr:MAG: hypothetical protein D084_Lepto4C00422G0007 [Leptospirillum sp. Group IV 'UBA BS']